MKNYYWASLIVWDDKFGSMDILSFLMVQRQVHVDLDYIKSEQTSLFLKSYVVKGSDCIKSG